MGASSPVAALDCGTNSTRLLVVDTAGRALERLMRITRLGERVDANRRLSPEAIERTATTLREFRQVMHRLGVGRARLVATSAVRDAVNGNEFLSAASAAAGVTAELLDGEEEGRLAYRGATLGLCETSGDIVVIDIGGGSTELGLGASASVHALSLDLGCVRLSERHLRHDPPTGDELQVMVATINAELNRATAVMPGLARLPVQGSRLIGLAGTVSTLAALEQRLTDYVRERIHHFTLTRSTVERWCDILAAEPAAARAARPGIVTGREDVIVGGAFVLREAMRRFGFSTVLVSEADMLDGMVAGLLADAKVSGSVNPDA